MTTQINPKHAMLAYKLGGMTAAQNPLTSKAAFAALPPAHQAHIMAIAAHPAMAAVATQAANGGGGASGHVPAHTTGAARSSGALNPKYDRKRDPSMRHQLLPFTSAAIGSGATVGASATPQDRYRATRMNISAITIATGTDAASGVSQPQVGTDPQMVSLDAEPFSSFAAGNQASYLQGFDEAPPAIAISIQVTAAASCTFYAGFFGEVPGKAPEAMPGSARPGRLPIKATNIAAGSTITVTATPQKQFYGSKVNLADAGANQWGDTINVTAGANGASGLLLQNFYVGNKPQFISAPGAASAYFPGSGLMGLYDEWIDMDKAEIAQQVQFVVYNPGTVSLRFAGVIEGMYVP